MFWSLLSPHSPALFKCTYVRQSPRLTSCWWSGLWQWPGSLMTRLQSVSWCNDCYCGSSPRHSPLARQHLLKSPSHYRGHCYGSLSRLETGVLMRTRQDLFRVKIIWLVLMSVNLKSFKIIWAIILCIKEVANIAKISNYVDIACIMN